METIATLIGKLNEMTTEGIRVFLGSERIQGYVLAPEECPIAMLLVRDANVSSVKVATKVIMVRCSDGVEANFTPSPSLKQFIVKFDMRCYPELDKGKGDHDQLKRVLAWIYGTNAEQIESAQAKFLAATGVGIA